MSKLSESSFLDELPLLGLAEAIIKCHRIQVIADIFLSFLLKQGFEFIKLVSYGSFIIVVAERRIKGVVLQG